MRERGVGSRLLIEQVVLANTAAGQARNENHLHTAGRARERATEREREREKEMGEREERRETLTP